MLHQLQEFSFIHSPPKLPRTIFAIVPPRHERESLILSWVKHDKCAWFHPEPLWARLADPSRGKGKRI